MGHLWRFSPSFFILVWDAKGILQLSVKTAVVNKIFLYFCLVSELLVD